MATMTITKLDVTTQPGMRPPIVKALVNGRWRKLPCTVEAKRG
jgi:hypothetical protein